jgi:predicted RNase H-like HicB family nuclease
MSQAQNRFYTQLEDWLSTTVRDLGVESDVRGAPGTAPAGAEIKIAIDRLKDAIAETGSGKAATAAMANLAEAIQGLVKHMRTEQQLIRDWVDSQAEQQREIQRLLERIAREDVRER